MAESTKSFMKELPILPTWAGKLVPAREILGICPEAVLQTIACSPRELPQAVQVRLPCLTLSLTQMQHIA